MIRPGRGGPPSIPGRWPDVIEEAEATADEFGERGFSVTMLHPGDVAPIPADGAFDVLLPRSEFDTIESLAETFVAESVTVYTAEDGPFTYAVIVATDASADTAICCPIFFETGAVEELTEGARDAGAVELRLRPLSRESEVVIAIDDIDLVFSA